MEKFKGNFTQQEPISEEAIAAALRVLHSGRLHRYNLTEGEIGEVAELEREYATWQKSQYCLAVTSGGQAMQISLRAASVQAGDLVLTNAFTLAPVPGAIETVGGQSILVEIDENLCLDLNDLDQKARASKARFLLLSHMRGHLCDMDKLTKLAQQHNLTLIEDCAHTMGAKWNGQRSGNFGLAACFSTQTYKHLNSGEGGFITSNNAEFMARAIILSGSYMLYERHGAAPDSEIFEKVKYETPNCSARMDALRAAILRPQLQNIENAITRWNTRYEALANILQKSSQIQQPHRPKAEEIVGSSLQFRIPEFNHKSCKEFIANCAKMGVEIKWFGHKTPTGFTSNHQSWRFVKAQNLPQTDQILASLFDLRLPLTFSIEDCQNIGKIIIQAASETTTHK